MSFNYKIIKHIATLSETQDESKQVNIISYNNTKPKVDIRNWFDDNKMGKGITLDEEEWKVLGECFDNNSSDGNDYTDILEEVTWLNSTGVHKYEFILEDFGIETDCESELIVNEKEQMICYRIAFQTEKTKVQKYIEFINDTNKYFAENNIFANTYADFEDDKEFIKIAGKMPLTKLSEETLDAVGGFLADCADLINEIGAKTTRQLRFEDIIVISDKLACVHAEHKKEELLVAVDFVNKDGNIFRVEARACYCEKCNLFFMRNHDYQRMKNKGNRAVMLCQEITEERYLKNPKSLKLDLNDQSILHKYGYNVSGDLTQAQRQEILASIVDRKILSKDKVASYLAYFIRLNKNKEKDFSNAIDKWNCDRDFILSYNVDIIRKIEPRRITVIKYKPSK